MNDAITIPLRKEPKERTVLQGGESRQGNGQNEPWEQQLQLFAAMLGTMAMENERLNKELLAARRRADLLARKVVHVQEEERLRISRELHDEAGQALTALKFNLASIRAGLPVSDQSRAQLDELVELTDHTMDQIRRLAHNLPIRLSTPVERIACTPQGVVSDAEDLPLRLGQRVVAEGKYQRFLHHGHGPEPYMGTAVVLSDATPLWVSTGDAPADLQKWLDQVVRMEGTLAPGPDGDPGTWLSARGAPATRFSAYSARPGIKGRTTAGFST